VRIYLILGMVAGMAVLSGCQNTTEIVPGGIPESGFGDSVRSNIAVQTVNPGAPVADEPMTSNGARAAIAQDRYVRDRVKVPGDPTTSSVVTSGQGGTSAGASSGN